jgi:hypothetical protein
LFFSTLRVLFTMNLSLLTVQSTPDFTATWEKMCHDKDQNFGVTTPDSFIMKMCPPTHPWKPQSLWLNTTWL